MAEEKEAPILSALEEVDEGLMGIEKELKGLNEHLEEHTRTDEHYREILEKMYASHKNKNKEENTMQVELPTVVTNGNNDNAALIAALMGNRNGYGYGEGSGALGLGGGLAGGVLLGALLGQNGGLFGGRNNGADLGVQAAVDTNSILQGLGDIKAAVPLAEAQTQLAIAIAQSELAGQINTANIANLNGQGMINKNISDAIASSLASQNNINLNVLQTAAAGISATKDSQYALAAAIKDDGEKTRALITSNTITELQRQLSVAEIAALEDRLHNRSREVEVNVTQTVNQNQLQAQAQQQQQQQTILLSNLCSHIAGLQNAVATNSNLIVGNTGAVATGTQTANPVNVRA